MLSSLFVLAAFVVTIGPGHSYDDLVVRQKNLIAECKYCWHTSGFGKSTHFYCGAFEYCCGDKCCENFNEFYKLWYFWLCVLVLLLSGCVLLYWLKRRFYLHHNVDTSLPRQRRHRRRYRRRYRQLTGESNSSADVLPVTSAPCPPPYGGDNTGCPHPGPPPYTLGSGSSINSQTLPRFPPSYDQVTKDALPPSYSSLAEVVTVLDMEGKKQCDIDSSCGASSNTNSNSSNNTSSKNNNNSGNRNNTSSSSNISSSNISSSYNSSGSDNSRSCTNTNDNVHGDCGSAS